MMQRAWTLVSGFVTLTAVGMLACSSADTPENGDDDNGTGGTSSTSGGAGGTSGTTGATGGTTSAGTGGSGATTSGGSGGAAGGSAVNTDPECKGISRDAACTLTDKMCPNLACGIADSGRRECNCTGTWSCTSCDYTNSPFKDMPADIPMCSDAADEVTCTAEGSVCGPIGTEYCACFRDATDGLIWDCDSPPSTWGI